MTKDKIIVKLKKLKNPKNIEGMARFGIKPNTEVLGISIYDLRPISKNIKRELNDSIKLHKLALKLWQVNIHEARLLAVFIEDPKEVIEKQMESWIKDFDSWDICDQACTSLFDKTPFAFKKALEWSKRKKEFEKRAGFALMAGISVHDKNAKDNKFIPFLKAIKREAKDDRNFVKKAVNWALRQIGKSRNKNLYKLAVSSANEIKKIDSKSAKWIANDALRELKSDSVKKRLNFT
ncbi:MAG: DNA alkylation repair protein [Candidatus Levyibacteriota bacterium]